MITDKYSVLEYDYLQMAVKHAALPKPREGTIVYADGSNWNPLSGSGLYAYNGTNYEYLGDKWQYLALSSDSSVSSSSFSNVPGMSFTAGIGKSYEIEIFGAFNTAATNNGIGVVLDIPSGSVFGAAIAPSDNTTAMITQQNTDGANLSNTTGVGAAGTNYFLWGKWLVTIGWTGGPVNLQQRSSVNSVNSTIVAGTRMKWREI